MRKIYYFFVNSGKILTIFSVLFLIAISLSALTLKGEINYGNRCYVEVNKEIIKEFNYNKVNLEDSKLECNTLYLKYNSSLNEEKDILFLASLSKFLSDNDIECDTQITIKHEEHLVLATIINYQISYVKTIY